MKIGKTQNGIHYARYSGFVAIGNSSAQAFNNLVALFHGAKANGSNAVNKAKKQYQCLSRITAPMRTGTLRKSNSKRASIAAT